MPAKKSGPKAGEMTIAEFAKREGVSEGAVKDWIRKGKITARHAVPEGKKRGPWYIPKKQKRPAGYVRVLRFA